MARNIIDIKGGRSEIWCTCNFLGLTPVLMENDLIPIQNSVVISQDSLGHDCHGGCREASTDNRLLTYALLRSQDSIGTNGLV